MSDEIKNTAKKASSKSAKDIEEKTGGHWFPYVFFGVVGLSAAGLVGAQFEKPVPSKIIAEWHVKQGQAEAGIEDPFKTNKIDTSNEQSDPKEGETIPPSFKITDGKPAEAPKDDRADRPKPVSWTEYAVAAPDLNGRIPIISVIDDMGMSPDATDQFAALKGPITYAFLPYANNLDQQTKTVKAMGHELLVHLPMEPKVTNPDLGNNALVRDLPYEETLRRIDWNLKRFKGFIGVNNHMGSEYTASRSFMYPVLSEIKARDLMFLDSKTASNSVASELSIELDIPTVSRDVFLDNIRTVEAIVRQLNTVENIARRRGYAVAIGHPHRVTLQSLRAWIPTLERKGFVLWPLSAVLLKKAQLAD